MPVNSSEGCSAEGSFKWMSVVRWGPALLLLLWMLVTARAFISIYDGGHSYEVASRWIFRNVKPGAKILEGHWDDTLPVPLPGVPAIRYQREGREWELGLYERDSPEKLRQIASQISRGDYIVFPTQRLHGSLLRVPQEFPLTDAFYKLLFGEHLGYKLVYTYKKEPSIFGLVFDDDLADESLSVYDHPKVTIFRNVEYLPADEIQRRIEHADQFGPLMSREQIMRVDSKD